MFVWDFCNVTLCVLLVFLVVNTQQSIEDNLNIRQKYPSGESDMADASKISRHEESSKPVSPHSSAVIELQQDQHEKDPESKLEFPNLISIIEAHLQDDNEGNEYKDKHQKREAELDSIIQEVFPKNSVHEYEVRGSSNDPQSQTEHKINHDDPIIGVPRRKSFRKVVSKGGLPGRNILKRKRILKRLRPPMFRSSQQNTDEISEQNTDDLLHNILESIDQENSENGNSIKHAFITKTTTYNISKLDENSKNKSFLIEKIVNYSTNINTLHPENIPTNYTDSHSSVLQTVLNLGQLENNTSDETNNEENKKQSYRSFDHEEDLSDDFVGSKVKLDVNNEDEMSEKLPEDHQAPSEFLGGQYLHPNKSPNITSNQTDKENNHQEPADFVGGQYIGIINEKDFNSLDSKDSKNNLFDFVGGQFVEQPLGTDEKPSETSRNDFKKTSGNVIDRQTTTEDDITPSTVTAETHTHNPLHDIPSLSLTQELSHKVQSDNSYESTTLSDQIQNTDEVLLGKEKTSFNQDTDELKMEKKSRVSTPKTDGDKNKKPSKATGEKNKVIKSTSPEKSDRSLEKSYLKNEKTTDDSFEWSTTSTYEGSFDKNLGSNEEGVHPSKENVEGQSASTPEGGELLSSEIEQYSTPKNFVGLKPTNSFGNTEYQAGTGKLIEVVDRYDQGEETTDEDGNEWVGSVSTPQPISSGEGLLFSDRGLDHVVGEASDILQNKFGNDSFNTESGDQSSTGDPLDEDQSITTLIDEVELYAGKVTVSGTIEPEYQTTEKYKSETNVYKPFEIMSRDSKEENTTEICIPVTKENYPTLLDLLSGNLYLEKDGRKMNLQIVDNPMKHCNSGTKNCKLFFNLKDENEPSITEEMFNPEDKKINKSLNSKSKNGKRQISMEDEEFAPPESKTGMETQENGEKVTESPELMQELSQENEGVVVLTVNKAANNLSIQNFYPTEKSNIVKPQESTKPTPVQSMFVRLPVPYKTPGFDIKNTRKNTNDHEQKEASQTNGEKITLYSLDSPHHKVGFPKGIRLARKIHWKRDSPGHIGGACGCNNPLLLSPSPIPDFRHFVGKRLAILTNMVSTAKDWALEEAMNPKV